MDEPRPICARCGYELTGVRARGRVAECPECGAGFDPANPLVLRSWPAWWRIAWRLGGWNLWATAGVLGIVKGVGWAAGEGLAALAVVVLLPAWMWGVFCAPVGGAAEICGASAAPGRVERATFALAAIGVGGNAVVTVVLARWLLG